MKRLVLCFCLLVIGSGCSSSGLLIPLVGIPSTNYLTRDYYENRYAEYDRRYRQTVNFEELRIPRGRYTLYAREFNAREDTGKPAIILMHGFPDSLHLYDRLAPILSQHYRVISFDFLGWGASEKPEEHRYDTQSLYQDLDAVIEYFELDRVSLVVHDASGPPGIQWVLDHPEKTDALVLLNTFYHRTDGLIPPEAIKTYSTPGIKRSILRTGARLSDYGWRTGYQNQVGKFFHDPEQRDLMLPVLTHQAMDIRNAFFQLNDVLNDEIIIRTQRKHLLREYTGPVVIIFGEEDPYLNAMVAKDLESSFPNSALHLIPEAAHLVQLDRPYEVADKILGIGRNRLDAANSITRKNGFPGVKVNLTDCTRQQNANYLNR